MKALLKTFFPRNTDKEIEVPCLFTRGKKRVKCPLTYAEAMQMVLDFLTEIGPTRLISVAENKDFEGCHQINVYYWDETPLQYMKHLKEKTENQATELTLLQGKLKDLEREKNRYKDMYEEYYAIDRERKCFP